MRARQIGLSVMAGALSVAGNISSGGQFLAADGTAGAPSYSFTSTPTAGMFLGASLLQFSFSSAARLACHATSSDSCVTVLTGLAFGATLAARDAYIIREGANSLSVRAGTNAQTFSVHNTYTTGTPDYERLEMFWTSNTAVIRTGLSGTGVARALQFRYGNSTSIALQINTAISGGCLVGGTSTAAAFGLGLFAVGSSTYSALSGAVTLQVNSATFQDGGTTSSTVAVCLQLSPTINYTAASKTGMVTCLYINPTNTLLPTGINAGVAFSTTASGLTGAVVMQNQADEITNAEYVYEKFNSNVWEIGSVKLGTGTLRGLRFGITGNAIGFMGATPVTRPSTTGETVGFTAGAGTAVNDASTFTGNVGATAYRLSDVVKHLKNLGLIAA